MGDDSTPGCISKFVADRALNESTRAANVDLLVYSTLIVARFKAHGAGVCLALQHGANGLSFGALVSVYVRQRTHSSATVASHTMRRILHTATPRSLVA